ncbi:nibrin [Trichonephila clavipes]|uniref:Nibrin n=1 Tax=Trichonephila clavipes TaxID=2585209 RepID=A0A8X6W5V2_TRICX|nr:nibrin [Trichonephila clavipes]
MAHLGRNYSFSRTDLHVQSVMMARHIYRDVILEQHVRLLWGHHGCIISVYGGQRPSSPCKHCRRKPSNGGYHPYGLASILTGLKSNGACVG